MHRQRLELVACVCLVAYATIVLAGQAVHWLPGLGCECHATSVAFYRVVTAGDALATQTVFLAKFDDRVNDPDFRYTPLRLTLSTTIESNNKCPTCHWFSMAQQQALSVKLALDDQILGTLTRPTCEPGYRTLRALLPRGPPLGFAS